MHRDHVVLGRQLRGGHVNRTDRVRASGWNEHAGPDVFAAHDPDGCMGGGKRARVGVAAKANADPLRSVRDDDAPIGCGTPDAHG